jgi:hypothetical protein
MGRCASVKSDRFPKSIIAADDRIGLHKFCDHHICTLLFTELAEDHIGKTRHWSQIEGEFTVFEPRQHKISTYRVDFLE